MKTAVLYHNDADGFGAAYACRKRFKDAALYIPVQYGQPVPELPESVNELFIVDFSYDRTTCEKLAEKYCRLVILDHHKTAEQALNGFPYAEFDMHRSGAVMAWNYFFGQIVPDILQYVQDRDLWRFELPASEEINLYIASMPKTFIAWDYFDLETAVSGGSAIKAFRDAQVERACRNARFEDIGGHNVPVVNLSDNISEVGNQLCQMYPDAHFSASYCDRADGRRSFSLRSVGDFDVSIVAGMFGGGGHRNAAGFSLGINK